MPQHVYHGHIYRSSVTGELIWKVTRTRWAGPGHQSVSGLVAGGTLEDFRVPAGLPAEQASALFTAMSDALGRFLEDQLREIDARP